MRFSFSCHSIWNVLNRDAAFPRKYLHTTNPCKLLDLCISERFCFVRHTTSACELMHESAYLIRNIDNTGSFSQFLSLISYWFLLPRQPICFKANILYCEAFQRKYCTRSMPKDAMVFFFLIEIVIWILRVLQWI